MYENITYGELKNLPEDRKAEAWGELYSLYSHSNVELAKKLGVATIAVVNAVKKYVLGEPVGRANKANKKSKQKLQIQEELERELPQEPQKEARPKRKYNRKAKAEPVVEALNVEKTVSHEPAAAVSKGSFSVTINKTLSGEAAQAVLKGLADIFIKSQQYDIEVKINEK
jgi:hypothetical protein